MERRLMLIFPLCLSTVRGNAHLVNERALQLSSAIPTAFSPRVSATCLNDSLNVLNSIFRIEGSDWAWKMLDASGKLPEMFLNVNKQRTGNFDQCLAVTTPAFHGKYCTVFLEDGSSSSMTQTLRRAVALGAETKASTIADGPNVSTTRNFNQPSVGLCVPSSCKATDVRAAVAHLLATQLIGNLSSITVSTEEDFCFIKSDTDVFDAVDVAVSAFFSALAAVVVAGTCIESWHLYNCKRQPGCSIGGPHDSVWLRAILRFSLVGNAQRLLSKATSEDGDVLSCLYGLRFLLMCWVVIGHVWIQGVLHYNQNLAGLYTDALALPFQAIGNATVSVDGFFLIGGLLVAYNLLRYVDGNKGRFNAINYYCLRYVRLMPAYAAVFAFVSTLLVHLGSGPNWFTVKFTSANCRRVWWQHLTFINNFVPKGANEQCMTETWYLAADWQFFIVSPLLVLPLARWKSKGLVWLACVTVGSLAGNVAMFFFKSLPPTSMITRPLTMQKSLVDFWVYYYPQPWFRIPSYLVGVTVGYALYITRGKPVKLGRALVGFGWGAACSTCFLVIFGLSPYLNEETVPHINPVISTLYGAFHRFAFAAALGWMIFACARGYGGVVNSFLSWHLFVPLGRLCYCTYLVHYTVISVYYAHKRHPSYYTVMDQLFSVSGNLSLSILLALVFHLTVEMPFLRLGKMSQLQTRTRSTSQPLNNTDKSARGKINQAYAIE